MQALREGIDGIDDRIQDLLVQRAELVLAVGALKERRRDAPFYRPDREARIHRRLEARHRGPLPVAALHRIYREIISASLNLEKPLTISYLGPEAGFTHQASIKQFGSSATLQEVWSIDEVFHEVEIGRANYGVVPVENSTEGMVTYTLDRFSDSSLRICGEVLLPVVHHLLSREAHLDTVERLYGHHRALLQCRRWIDRHLPKVAVNEVNSTAKALEKARDEKRSAAIGGEYGADSYGLEVLAEHVEDFADMENRFLVIGRQDPEPTGQDQTSLMFSFRDHPGFLHQVLGIFAQRGVNLTRIESRPSRRRAWDYNFFVDLEGHFEDVAIADALTALTLVPGVSTRVLGSYPRPAL
ncbi:MAG: prephenate dehydratase [Magnetococcales bacterium]|nr:prephenate dehydratase [Magnetococcales bacterium]